MLMHAPTAPAAARERLQHYLKQKEFEKLPIRLQAAKTDLACTAADAVLVASGTATLEVALCKRPMVISYRISPLTYALVRHRIKVPHVGLPNILLGREAVPELLQRRAKPKLLAEAMLDWYRQPEKSAELAQAFTELHQLLRRDSGRIAAEAVLAEAGCPVADPLPADDGSGSGQETAAAAPSDTGATT